jgi:hypothetical protein
VAGRQGGGRKIMREIMREIMSATVKQQQQKTDLRNVT